MNPPVQNGVDKAGQRKLRNIWHGMKGRCLNRRHPRFATHGGRGIGMDPLWKRSFGVFRTWALANGYAPGLALNRIDKKKGYEPSNCRWSISYSRSHDARPVIRSDGVRFESIRAALRETPRAHAYGIHLVTRGLQKTSGGYMWRFERSAGGAT